MVVASEKKVATDVAAAVAEAVPVYAAGSKLGAAGFVAPGNGEDSDHGPAAGSAVVARYHPD